MAKTYKYYECKTSGTGICWFCETKTNFILDDGRDEIFCCFACAMKHYRNSKLHRKVRAFKKIRVFKGRATTLSQNSKFLPTKNQQTILQIREGGENATY